MRKGAAVLAFLALCSPAALRAQGVAIDHGGVGCVVAGQNPRLNACFAPASRLARARVYFRVAGAAPDWYYVEMASDAPCHAGVLPRPKKELVGRRIQYYVDAFDRSFAESRTPEAEAMVVSSASDCQSKLPVAPIVNGASVAVFPGLPAGFAGAAAGGLGGGATALIAVGGAAVVGGGVAMAAGGSSSEPGGGTTPTTAPPPSTLPPPTTATTTTTLPAGTFNPVFKVYRGTALETGDTIVGTEPLVLRFDMCESTAGPYRLRYGVEVDGAQRTDRCNSTITFTTASAVPDIEASVVRQSATATSRTYAVRMTIRSEGPNNDPKANRLLTVQVLSSGGGCGSDKQGPVVSLTKPADGSVYPSPSAYPVHFEASASDATTGNNGVAFVEYKVNYPGPDQQILGPVTSGSPWPYDWTQSAVNAYLGTACAKFLEVQAYAQDNCGNASYSAKRQITINNTGPCVTPDPRLASGQSSSSATFVSDLGVAGGAGQVVANGEAAFPRAGRTPFAVRVKRGRTASRRRSSRRARSGRGGSSSGRCRASGPTRLRVVAGDVVQLAADSVTFRLQGRPGERVVFLFRAGE